MLPLWASGSSGVAHAYAHCRAADGAGLLLGVTLIWSGNVLSLACAASSSPSAARTFLSPARPATSSSATRSSGDGEQREDGAGGGAAELLLRCAAGLLTSRNVSHAFRKLAVAYAARSPGYNCASGRCTGLWCLCDIHASAWQMTVMNATRPCGRVPRPAPDAIRRSALDARVGGRAQGR